MKEGLLPMDGDSGTGRRSPALCPSHRGARGLSAPHKFSFKKKKEEEKRIFFFLLRGSDGFRYSAVLVQKQRCSQSPSLYATLATPELGPRAHLPAAARPGRTDGRTDGTRGWSGFCTLGGPSAIRRARSCCSSVRDVRRNGNTRTEEGRAGGGGGGEWWWWWWWWGLE